MSWCFILHVVGVVCQARCCASCGLVVYDCCESQFKHVVVLVLC